MAKENVSLDSRVKKKGWNKELYFRRIKTWFNKWKT